MKWIIIFTITLTAILYTGCLENHVSNKKDLDENMIDMMMYHDNLGLYIRKGDADYALWLLSGMDSSLQVISQNFTEHRKLSQPFEKEYQLKLLPAIEKIKTALEEKNFPSAIQAYQTLTRKCNGCHADHNVNKEVIDRSKSD
jgi:hypothetical protein